MEKPITLKIEETRQDIIDTLNSSGLHPFILDAIMKDLYNETHILYRNLTEQDKKTYQQPKESETAESTVSSTIRS